MQHYILCVDDTDQCIPNRKLPPILYLKMDSCSVNKKYIFVFSFLSLLTTRRVFKIFEVGFLLVGHTHENIDGTYGKLSAKLMHKDIFSLSEIMDTYRTCEDHNFHVLYLIDESFILRIL